MKRSDVFPPAAAAGGEEEERMKRRPQGYGHVTGPGVQKSTGELVGKLFATVLPALTTTLTIV